MYAPLFPTSSGTRREHKFPPYLILGAAPLSASSTAQSIELRLHIAYIWLTLYLLSKDARHMNGGNTPSVVICNAGNFWQLQVHGESLRGNGLFDIENNISCKLD